MYKIITVILILFLLSIKSSFSQTRDTITHAYKSVQNYDMDASTIKKMGHPEKRAFEGSYHFGDSEGESQLEIIYSNGKFFARTEYADWEKNTRVAKSDRLSATYSNDAIVIENTEFELAFSEGIKGLLSNTYENKEGKTHHYIQFNPNGIIEKPKGAHPESSFVKLTLEDLKNFSKKELKLVRNEIFARKGYAFKKGGDMETYFSNQDWYTVIPKTSTLNLNNIEKHNIDLISELEKENKSDSLKSFTEKDQQFRDTIIIQYSEHKALLNILKTLPETAMSSWEWRNEDRRKAVESIEKHNYLIDSSETYNTIKYIKPNTIGIQVVDGFWILSIYKLNDNHYFIITNDMVGDGNDIQTFIYINNTIVPTKMVNWFSEFDSKLLLKNSSTCIELIEDYQMTFQYDISDKNSIEIKSTELTKANSKDCLKGNTIKYRLNKKTKTFDIVGVYWVNSKTE